MLAGKEIAMVALHFENAENLDLYLFSEFIRFPRRMRPPTSAMGITILSNTHEAGFLLTQAEKMKRAMILAIVPPWLARPPSQILKISPGCCE